MASGRAGCGEGRGTHPTGRNAFSLLSQRFTMKIRDKVKKARADMVAELVKQGVTAEAAEQAVGEIGDGKILAWLMLHGPDIVKLIKMLFGL